MPYCLFTDPPLARVGLSEADARRDSIQVRVARLPVAAILRALQEGRASQAEIDDLTQFMSTLPGRGVCRLPDGAARVVLSLLEHSRNEVLVHAKGECLARQ